MEGCLMEDKMAWKRVHTELVENHRLAQDANATLTKARACRTELFSYLTSHENRGLEGERKKNNPEEGDFLVLRQFWTLNSHFKRSDVLL